MIIIKWVIRSRNKDRKLQNNRHSKKQPECKDIWILSWLWFRNFQIANCNRINIRWVIKYRNRDGNCKITKFQLKCPVWFSRFNHAHKISLCVMLLSFRRDTKPRRNFSSLIGRTLKSWRKCCRFQARIWRSMWDYFHSFCSVYRLCFSWAI